MKIKSKINISFFTTFVLVVSLLGLMVGIYTTSIVKNNIFSYLYSSSRTRAEHIRTFFQSQKNSTRILAGTLSVENFLKLKNTDATYITDREALEVCFGEVIEDDPHIYEIFMIDTYGKIVLSTDKSQLGLDKSDDSYFTEGKKDTYIKDIYISESIKKINYTVSSPVRDNESDNVLGVLVVRYNPENFYSVVQSENGLGKTGENFLVNKDKFFVSPSHFLGEGVILKQKVETENVNECFDPKEIEYVNKNGYGGIVEEMGYQIAEAKDYRNVSVITTHAYIPETGWCLVTKVDKSDVLFFRIVLVFIFLAMFISTGLLFLLIGLLISKKITDPIKDLIVGTRKIEEGDLDYKIDVKTKDEIGKLSSSFNQMANSLRESRLDLEKYSEGLEIIVAERTKGLQDKIGELSKAREAILNIAEDAEAEKQKAQRLASIVENSNEAIFSKTLDGIITEWNQGGERLYGWTAKEIIGKSIKTIVPQDKFKEVEDIIKRVGGGERIEHYHTVRVKKNGERVDVSISASPVKDFSGKIIGISVITIDITKETQVDKAKTEFVSLASHQLRTPLSSINWYAEMLLAGDAGKLKPEQKKYLDEIYKGNQRMVSLVNALLNVSRLELGTFAIEPEPIDVVKLAQSVADEQKPQILAKKIKLNQKYANNLPKLNADPKLLRIVFQNLLSNAIKYTPDKGIISIDLHLDKDSIAFTVSDTGYGIPKAQQNQIFSKLFRADNVREKDTEGTGLGLYIVKSIVDHSNGKIWFESKENKGTTFYLTLPLAGMKKKEGTKELT